MDFSEQQLLAYNKYIAGENIFITGAGGTGKSALIRHIQQDASKKGHDIHVCALTGTAAVLLACKAKTVHSWAGIGKGTASTEALIEKIKKNRFLKQIWKATDILVIDEISMMSKSLFEKLDAIGRAIRMKQEPFGGIQLIFSGDFYQLPPVPDKDDLDTGKFCFESDIWFQTFKVENHVILSKIFRQSDPQWQKCLNQLREGRVKMSTNNLLLELVTSKQVDENMFVKPTKLFPTRKQVDYVNVSEMEKLSGDYYEYKIKYLGDLEMSKMDKLKRSHFSETQLEIEYNYLKGNIPCDTLIKLKVGAQVMCVVNIKADNGDIMLCNGSQGIVTGISPLGLPIVKYRNGIERIMEYHVWASETIPGVGVSQIPLILAWALTIHKSQGATLDIAEIDAGSGIFECGQTYVALSRVRSLEGLYLTSYDPRRIRINDKVQDFYDKLAEKLVTKMEEKKKREIERLPEAYVEPVAEEIPVAELVEEDFDT